MATDTLVIINPKSRGGRRARTRRVIEELVRDRFPGAEVVTTRAPNDARRLAREAAATGFARILVAGGDGSASEVAAGVLAEDASAGVAIGLLPLGTGRDFARGLGVADLRSAVDCIAAGASRPLDAGSVRFAETPGRESERFFVNVASAGLSAAVVRCVDASMKARFGQAAFAGGVVRALRSWTPSEREVWVDGERIVEGPLDMVAIANGSFFGGGMQVAPDAVADDGLFDVVVVRAMSTGQWLRRAPHVYRGRHLRYDEVVHCRGREIEIRGAAGTPFPLELDGEDRGHAPVVARILPGALRVMAPEGP